MLIPITYMLHGRWLCHVCYLVLRNKFSTFWHVLFSVFNGVFFPFILFRLHCRMFRCFCFAFWRTKTQWQQICLSSICTIALVRVISDVCIGTWLIGMWRLWCDAPSFRSCLPCTSERETFQKLKFDIYCMRKGDKDGRENENKTRNNVKKMIWHGRFALLARHLTLNHE